MKILNGFLAFVLCIFLANPPKVGASIVIDAFNPFPVSDPGNPGTTDLTLWVDMAFGGVKDLENKANPGVWDAFERVVDGPTYANNYGIASAGNNAWLVENTFFTVWNDTVRDGSYVIRYRTGPTFNGTDWLKGRNNNLNHRTATVGGCRYGLCSVASTGGTVSLANTWYTVVVTFEAKTSTNGDTIGYLNGVQDGSVIDHAWVTNTVVDLEIVEDGWDGAYVDFFAFYDRLLTPDEIAWFGDGTITREFTDLN